MGIGIEFKTQTVPGRLGPIFTQLFSSPSFCANHDLCFPVISKRPSGGLFLTEIQYLYIGFSVLLTCAGTESRFKIRGGSIVGDVRRFPLLTLLLFSRLRDFFFFFFLVCDFDVG